MLPVLKQIWTRDDAEALGWWQEILGFYAKGSKIRNADIEFISLVEGLWDNFSITQRRHALELLISVLSKEIPPSSAPGQPVYRASVETNRGTFSLSQRNHVLLVKLVPRIRQSAPDLLKKLKDADPIFAAMASDVVVESIHESTVYPRSSSDPTPSPAVASAFLADQKQYEQVRALAVKDPAKALSSALQLSRFSNDAFSYLTDSLEQAEPGGASVVLHSADQMLEKTTDKKLQLRLLVLKAESSRIVRDAALEAALTQGFDLGEELFEEYVQSHPATETSQVPVLEPLQALTRIGMRASPWNTLDHIRQLSDKPLEAYLLIEAARARAGAQVRNEAK